MHERFPSHGLWPADAAARAVARSVSAEVHAGFDALRQSMSMNIRGRYPDKGRTPECLADIERILAIWTDCRARFGGGDFLFGRFGIADAMVAPVVLRFQTYGAARDYADTALALPALQAWVADAEAGTERIEKFERDESGDGGGITPCGVAAICGVRCGRFPAPPDAGWCAKSEIDCGNAG